ncbi:hypothetical protein LCGC14_0548660 [marine sediment metagenome]|uniref:Uncharacterized protein n=1 Tax=marine sediment metagenome TaxID=412755 RepID=A0A0F9UC23_9ZZZZ
MGIGNETKIRDGLDRDKVNLVKIMLDILTYICYHLSMKTKGIKRTYYITEELEDGIRTLAYLRKTTLSDVVREALRWFLKAQEEELSEMSEVKLLRRDGTHLLVGGIENE